MALAPLLESRKSNYPDPLSLGMCDLSDVMDLLAASTGQSGRLTDHANILVDWKETPDFHLIHADIPGLTNEDVKVEVDKDRRVLEIIGEPPNDEEDPKDKYLLLEREHGIFVRRCTFPENAKLDEVHAKMDNGVLTLTIPKRPDHNHKPLIKRIEISD